MPATSLYWNEVGEEIRNVSVAYGAGEGPYDEESVTGSDHLKDGKDGKDGKDESGIRERKVGENF